MKVFEILSLNPEFLKRLHDFGIKHDDFKWLEMYQEYAKMKALGDKMVYIVATLAEKYKVFNIRAYFSL